MHLLKELMAFCGLGGELDRSLYVTTTDSTAECLRASAHHYISPSQEPLKTACLWFGVFLMSERQV